jgi:hypothetical protein
MWLFDYSEPHGRFIFRSAYIPSVKHICRIKLCFITYMKWIRAGEIPSEYRSTCLNSTTIGPILIKYYGKLQIVGPFLFLWRWMPRFYKLVYGIARITQNAMLQGACRPTVCCCGADCVFPVFLCSKRLTRPHWFPTCIQKFELLSHGAYLFWNTCRKIPNNLLYE